MCVNLYFETTVIQVLVNVQLQQVLEGAVACRCGAYITDIDDKVSRYDRQPVKTKKSTSS